MVSNQSFASVQRPDFTSEDEQQALLWGRFWEPDATEYIGVYLKFDLADEEAKGLGARTVTTEVVAERLDPDQHFARFRRELFDVDDTDPDRSSRVKQAIKDELLSETRRSALQESLANKNRGAFRDFVDRLFSRVCSSDEVIFQVRGELLSRSTLSKGPTNSSGSGTSGKSRDSSDNGQMDSPEGTLGEDEVLVQPITSPMNGKFPRELTIGDIVLLAPDSGAEETLAERINQPHETEIPGRLTSLTATPASLPQGFKGETGDFWGLGLNLTDQLSGRAFVHKDTQLKTENEDRTDQRSFQGDTSFEWIVIGGILLFSCLLFGLLFLFVA